jgi:hypothetical protein
MARQAGLYKKMTVFERFSKKFVRVQPKIALLWDLKIQSLKKNNGTFDQGNQRCKI